MRSRTFREGSVGLLLLAGLAVFGGVILWLNRFTVSQKSYKAIVEFAYVGGLRKGAVVQYRGVKVGNISAIRPTPNHVEVEIEITQPDLIIPKNVVVEANQTGFISGESVIDITPKTPLLVTSVPDKPLNKSCNSQIIVCNGSRLKGRIGISTDELIRSTTELSIRYSDPKFYTNVNKAVENAALAAANIAELSRSFTILSKSFQQQLNSFSATNNSVQRATNQLSASSTRTLNQISATTSQFGTTAQDIRLTANQANKLITNLDNLLTSNRSNLVTALNNITETSNQLRQTVSSLSPVVNRVTQGELVKNLETLSANAAQASTNLRNATNTLNDPKNLMVVQQTLDSARVTFQNTQKITSDLDELTGDPTFRQNLRQLVNGLKSLVSSTQQMQQQMQVATTLDSLKAAVDNPNAAIPTPERNQKQIMFNISPTALKTADKQSQPTAILFTPSSSQENLLKQLREYGEIRKQEK
ncbi:MAG: MCE family protein [Stigonema ocellatum SAG 48.90 = DSM 106950]|nr:MCE family protein [Stigonema ocellatum SAG 48.90 = DSM 106950]